jgi:paraquat-inducible protein B
MKQARQSRRPTSDRAILRGHPSSPALKQGERALGAIATLAGYGVVAPNDLAHTLKAIEEVARSLRALADMLQRNPEALLRGKGK